ncbi:VIT domain-containing protein [Haliangium sp.]|uniref:VIT domain-containing protein n=1 Tax=Haliangium sp. TaxID=2663208 RepID=UPI003D0CBE78
MPTAWPLRRVGLALAAWALAALLAPASAAHAEASLTDTRGQTDLRELSHELSVRFEGVVARVETRQTFLHQGPHPREAIYTFDLPVHAAVTGLSIRLGDGRTTTSTVVAADAAETAVSDPGAIEASPDPGLLRLIARDAPGIDGYDPRARATYELRLYPLAAGRPVTVTLTWAAPLRIDDGRLSLRLPDRGEAANLVRERVALHLGDAPGGFGFGPVSAGGQGFGRVRQARFAAPPRGDLVIDAALVPTDPGPGAHRPQLGFAAVPLGDGVGALGLSIINPRPTANRDELPYERLVLIIDVSRSLDRAGLAAAATLTQALLTRAPAATLVEAILYDREVHPLFGRFRPNDDHARAALDQALGAAALANGSDLGAALEHTGALLRSSPLAATPPQGFERGAHASTLVVVLSDGFTPLELTPRRALDRIGRDLLVDTQLAAVLLGPDDAPVPDTRAGVLPTLARRSGGRAVAVRYGESPARARSLATELGRAAPLADLTLDAGEAEIEDIHLPTRLEPGQGYFAIGFYRGPAPRGITVRGTAGPDQIAVTARRDPGLARLAPALALARAHGLDLASDDQRAAVRAAAGDDPDDPGSDAARAEAAVRRALVEAARRAGVVGRHSSLVALDSRDRFARDRLHMIKSWGPSAFSRLPPPPERGHALAAFERRVPPSAHAVDAQPRRTGQLDRDIVARLLDHHLAPRARACYETLLRRSPDLAGSLTVVVELGRGEAQYATVEGSTFPAGGMEACVVRAAYDIQVPRVALGDDPEVTSLVRWPLDFRRRAGRGEVVDGSHGPTKQRPLDTRTPLDGID